MKCPICGKKCKVLYGQRTIDKNGHVSNDAKPYICRECKRKAGEKLPGDKLHELNEKRKRGK